jgi:hypothetical protein
MLMINLKTINGKKLVLIGWAKDETGKDDVSAFTGTAKWDGKQLVLDRGNENSNFIIPNDWLDRLTIVNDDVKEVLMNADYSISFSIDDLPKGSSSEYIKTNLKWPN